MERYVYGIFLPVALSGVWFVLGERIPTWLARLRAGNRLEERGLLPASDPAYVFGALVAGAIVAGGFFLLNKRNPGEVAFQWGAIWLSYFVVLQWIGRNADTSKRAQHKRISLVLFIPFVSAAWATAGILSFVLR